MEAIVEQQHQRVSVGVNLKSIPIMSKYGLKRH